MIANPFVSATILCGAEMQEWQLVRNICGNLEYKQPYLCAEIGCNHCGSFDRAREMIKEAALFCKVPCVKFQKRSVRELLTLEEYSQEHPVPGNSYGSTYGEHRDFLEFSVDQHRELKELCTQLHISYSCSVWDVTSAEEISQLSPPFIKIPSACNTDFTLAARVCELYHDEIHVSLGMTTPGEVEAIVDFYTAQGRAGDLVLYHCTSGYPIKFDEVNLLEIVRLRELYSGRVKGLGFSGHHLGIAIDIAAYTLGVQYIERHFTLDRTQKGTDHAASLEPDGLRRLWRDLLATHAALTYKQSEILPVEEAPRKKLKWDRNQ